MKTIVVIGAGAAGLTAAYFAKTLQNRVILLERNDQAGKKILMSGGTRCNLLPMHFELSDYVSSGSQNTLRNIFKSWSLNSCKRWFEQDLGLAMSSEESTNKWFPSSNSAKEVRDVLVQGCLDKGVEIIYNFSVSDISPSEGNRWNIKSSSKSFLADAVILCSGGLSIPSAGTDGSGHLLLQDMGVEMIPTYPALTPLLGKSPAGERLSGITVSVSSQGKAQGYEISGNRSGLLFTHKGFSGPAVLDLSHVISNHEEGEIRVDFTEGSFDEVWKKAQTDNIGLHSFFRRVVPKRLADALVTESGLPDKKLAECSKVIRQQCAEFLSEYRLNVSSEEGYKKAEVTGGGVSLSEIAHKSMELKSHPGFYVCGEIIDVFGRIGGFNFYWAWVSGRLAGLSSAK